MLTSGNMMVTGDGWGTNGTRVVPGGTEWYQVVLSGNRMVISGNGVVMSGNTVETRGKAMPPHH